MRYVYIYMHIHFPKWHSTNIHVFTYMLSWSDTYMNLSNPLEIPLIS